ncbi:MAG: Flp family type IVb pilin [Acidimicrobiales bacterium]
MLHYHFIKAYALARVESDRGASLVEYALLLALIAVVCVTALNTLGKTTANEFSQVTSGINQ